MKRTLWKWAAPVVVLATVAVWGWGQETRQPVPFSGRGIPDSGVSPAPLGNPFRRPASSPSGIEDCSIQPATGFRVVEVVDSNGNRTEIRVPRNALIGSTLFVDDGNSRKVLTVVADPDGATGSVMAGGMGMGGAAGMPGMTAGPPGAGIPSGMYRRVVTRESFNLEKMVPLTAEEILESKQFQDLQQHMSDATKTDAEKELGRKQLAELLEKQFTRDFDTREKDVLELETRVQKLREQLNKRKAAKEKIIELRMTTIQNEIDGLGFPGGGGVVPGGGFTAPAYIPGSSFAPGMPNGLEPTLEPNSDAPAYNPPNPAPSVPRAHPFSVPADGVPVDATGFAPAPNVAPFAEPVPVNTNSPVELPSADKKAEEGGGANLLQNPSFEDGPNGWGTGTNPETVEYKIGDKGGTNLTRAAIIHKTADKYFPIAEWTQPIEYDGKSPVIQLMATVKTKDATKAILDVLFLDDKGEWIKHEWAAYIGDQSAEPKPLTHDWKVYKGAVSIPAGTKQIVIGLQDYGPGTVWFDDVSAVYLKELPQEPNHLPNNKQEPLSGL